MKIDPTHHHPAEPVSKKEIYSRDFHELTLSVESACEDVIKEDIPNWQAVLQTKQSVENRVTRAPHNKSAGKTVLVSDHYAFKNRAVMTRMAPLENSTPFSPPTKKHKH